MLNLEGIHLSEQPAEAVLGPLNEVEGRFAPERLYLAGDESLLGNGPRVSIVGSRKASEAGLRRARRLAGLLVREAVTVVSGLALGIDAAAHRAAIDSGGRTVAVLGTPLDRVYPQAHQELQLLIMREHLAISQFPPGLAVRRWHFPQRNRTMALISDATVIVEAGETSGSQSQGWEALRLGRPLFFLRSLVTHDAPRWIEEQLGYGAQVLSEPEELLEQLPSTLAPTTAAL